MYVKFTTVVNVDAYGAARSVAPVSIKMDGVPPVLSTRTVLSNTTCTLMATPTFFAPFTALLVTLETVGATVSITMVAEDELDTLVAVSVCVAEIDQVPSTKVVRSQVEPDVEPLMEHTTFVSPDFVAVTVIVPPASAATTFTVGALFLVMPSELLVPVSLAARSATDTGATGAVLSTVMEFVDASDIRLCASTP